MLDENGRCRLTELLPAECGCKDHRNSVDPESDVEGLRITAATRASYDNSCALNAAHFILVGDLIGMAVPVTSQGVVADQLGWACTQCVEAIQKVRT